MSGQSHCGDEEYTKPSKHKRWNENTGRPVAPKPMGGTEILNLRTQYAKMFNCPVNDIGTKFEKIHDAYDEDRDDFLELKLTWKYVHPETGEPMEKTIYTQKVPIPENVRQEVLKRQQGEHLAIENKKTKK